MGTILLGRERAFGQLCEDLAEAFGGVEDVVGVAAGHLLVDARLLGLLLGRVHGIERLGRRTQRVLGGEPGDRRIVVEFGLDPRVKCRERGERSFDVWFWLCSPV